MLRFECDNCHRLKNSNEAWILGFAAERIGVVSARREVRIATRWDADRALELLAVHFCSDPCRADYMQAIFGDDSAPVIREFEVVAEKLPARASARVSRRSTAKKRKRA